MRATRALKEGGLRLSLLFIFTGYLLGQVQVLSKEGMTQEKFVTAGERYSVVLNVINPTERDIELLIVQRDLVFDRGKTIFKDAGSLQRSNATWIQIKSPRMWLKAKRKAQMKFPVHVPKDAGAGSYHSLLCVQSQPHLKSQAVRAMTIHVRVAFQIITTIKGGVSKVKITRAEVKENKLWVDIENTGSNVVTVKVRPDDEKIESRKVLVYPDQTQTTKLECGTLIDGKHKVRFILDDGRAMLIPQMIEFQKGEIEQVKKSPLSRLKGEKIKRRKPTGKKYKLYLALSYGDRYQGLNLAGNARFGNFTLNAGSTWTEYRLTDYDYSSYRVMANYRKDWFRIGFGSYLFGDRWQSAIRAGVNLRYTNLGVSYLKESKTISVSVNQRLFKKYSITFSGYKSPSRQSWNFSLMIPII